MAELQTTRQGQSRASPGLPKRNNQGEHSAILSAVEALPNGYADPVVVSSAGR